MLVPVSKISDIGLAVQATRKAQKLRTTDIEGCARVRKGLAHDLGQENSSAKLAQVLKLMGELGIVVHLDLPEAAADEYRRMRATGARGASPAHLRGPRATRAMDGGAG